MVRKDGGELVPVSYEETIEAAAKILVNSRRTLSYGWCSTSCEAVSGAIQLAEETGSIIDSTANVCHGPTALAAQEKGSPFSLPGRNKEQGRCNSFLGAATLCTPIPGTCPVIQAFQRDSSRKKGEKAEKW